MITSRLSSALNFVKSLWAANLVIYRAAPGLTILMWAVMIFDGMIPTLLLLIQRSIVNHLEFLLDPSGAELWTFAAIALIVMFAVLRATQGLNDTLIGYLLDQLRDLVATDATERLLRRIGDWHSLDLHEDPKTLDTLNLALRGINGYRELSWGLFSIITAFIGIIPLTIALGTVEWWIPLVVMLSVAPGIWMSLRIFRIEWAERARLSQDERRRDIRYSITSSSEYARDSRLFNILPSQISSWRDEAMPILNALVRVRMSFLRKVAPWIFVFGLLIILPMITIMNNTINGQGTIGDFVLVIGSLTAMHFMIAAIAGNGSNLGSSLTGIEKYHEFLSLEPKQVRGINSSQTLPSLKRGLMIENISFAYPRAEQSTLSEFDLTIRAGERVAIVGENGAGKTTLSRLITRLFDVQQGDIRWDDTSIYDVDPRTLRSMLAVIPQDFAKFSVSLRENIALGRIDNPPTDDEIIRVLTEVGLGKLLARSDNALDMPLTTELDGGTQLSGGQWQRIAIARAMIRADQADIVIMDEPTAAVDPLAEVDITRRMMQMAKGKTTIVISHRLGICTLVDRVIVMEGGQIVEDGSHASLMATNGTYAEMFRAQSSWYQTAEPSA